MILLLFAISVPVAAYLFVKWKYGYWKRLGIPFSKPIFPYGNINNTKITKVHSALYMDKCYKELKGKGPFGGMYLVINPFVFVTSLDMVKTILVKDFNYFMNRGLFYNEKDDPLSAHLFNIDEPKWKNLRIKLTPTFTSGKMKYMYQTIIDVANEFKSTIDNELKISSEIEFKEILCRFTTDVIGTCAFGIECNSLKDPEAEFRRMGRETFEPRKNLDRFKLIFATAFPNLARAFHMSSTRNDISEFFLNAVRDTVAYREENQVKRKDFMDLLINLKNSTDSDFSVDEIAAQAFVFFLAGFETSSTAMSYALYELSLNQEIQNKAREEVHRVLKKHNEEFSYEAMIELKYVEQIINESLRKYPPLSTLFRTVNQTYKEPTTGIIFEKGTFIFIPVYSIHHDPEYYPNPEVFDPDRFSEEEMKTRNPYSFLPFGEGPRNCIGLRFGMMQAKVGLATILQNYRIKRSDKTPVPVTFKTDTFILTSEGGLYLNLEKI